ncbi:hypothetical protein ACFOWU_05305 [Epilithonimonas zeae]|uniref:LysM domain-containing protein n=1 Tax=Epilithonimonas zeae TaxID=1416779 RepID=A0A1N6F870_9FLAO|nr:hypothetical protein [Epilithonimonas zeae]SIN91482.1 hypothetical protein SAMN05444409_1116 [Epilithonimonas zeae]
MVSEDSFIKLKINGLLDLEALSKEYQISKGEIIKFHNQYCEIGEILPLHLPKYVPFLYLPKRNYENRNSEFVKTSDLQYPVGISQKKYGVVIKYLHSNTQIHFEVDVKRDGHLVEINKGKNYINNAEVDNIIEKLFEKAEQAIYPLKITVDKKGGFSKIENENEIKERWEKDYFPKLKEYYVGETAEDILKKMDLTFRNLKSRQTYFSQSIFYKLFFLPVYQSYFNYSKDGSVYFYFAHIQSDIVFNIKYTLDKKYTRGNKIALRIVGNEADNEWVQKEQKGSVNWLYKFHKDTHDLFSITGSVSTFDKGKELKTEVQIFEI